MCEHDEHPPLKYSAADNPAWQWDPETIEEVLRGPMFVDAPDLDDRAGLSIPTTAAYYAKQTLYRMEEFLDDAEQAARTFYVPRIEPVYRAADTLIRSELSAALSLRGIEMAIPSFHRLRANKNHAIIQRSGALVLSSSLQVLRSRHNDTGDTSFVGSKYAFAKRSH